MTALRGRIPRWVYGVSLLCFLYASVEGLCYLGLRALSWKGAHYRPLPSSLSPKQKSLIASRLASSPKLYRHHPVLGWAPVANGRSAEVRINSDGIRSDHDYSGDVDPTRVRLAAFGDSFTFGSEVGNAATWEAQLESQNAQFEVLNFGSDAYGLDQAYLRYLVDGVAFHSDIVVIGFMSENIYRNLNVFRPFYSSYYQDALFTKPRFMIEQGAIRLLMNPLSSADDYRQFVAEDEAGLRALGRHDYFYQLGYVAGPMDRLPSVRLVKVLSHSIKQAFNPVVTKEGSYAVPSEAFALTTTLLREFGCAVLRHGSLPVIVIYPDLEDLARARAHQPRRYRALLDHLQNQGVDYLDVLDAFVTNDPTLPADRLTVGTWGHYSPFGHQLVAYFVQRYLGDQGLTKRDAVLQRRLAVQSKRNCSGTTTLDLPHEPNGVRES